MSELRTVLAESFHTHNEETLITEIYKLQAENKALKYSAKNRELLIKELEGRLSDFCQSLESTEQSRNELLEFAEAHKAWSQYEEDAYNKMIQKAHALKGENK